MSENSSIKNTIAKTTAAAEDDLSKDTQGCFMAAILMLSFAGSLIWGFWQVSYIINSALSSPEVTAADRSAAIKDALQILMTVGSLFSPLLAFVLGYYFNQSQTARKARKSAEMEDEG